MIFDEDGLLEEPCLSCDRAYVEDIWNEWCCDKKECLHKIENKDLCKAETEDKVIKEIQVNTTLYVTDDGERFNTLKSAQEHEKHLEAVKKLETFKIDGPSCTPFDEVTILAYNWQWFKVHDHDELDQVLRLIYKAYNIGHIRYFRDKCSKFPQYIGVSCNHKCMDTLTNVERRHDLKMIKWENFYRAFMIDMESDDHFRDAQEEC